MTRKKTRKFQPGTAPVNNITPAKASTAGKAEGVETISGGSNRWTSPVITTAKIREIEDSALLQEPIQNLINLIFRGPAQVTVYDPAGNTDDALSEQAARRYQDLDLYTAHQQAFYDGLMGGCGVFSPGYDEVLKADVFRHMPWHSFSKQPMGFTDTYNEIMPGIVVDPSTRQTRVFQVQSEMMVEPVEIQNFAIIRDPTGPAPAGKPMCLPVVPIVWNYNYAIKVIQQKLNRVGAPPVFPLADVTAKTKDLWESFAKTWGKDTVFVLPKDTQFADIKIMDNRVAEDYVNWLKKQATDYWNPATFVQKDGNSIGGSDSGAMELVYNYIDRTLSWIENGITKATQNFLLNGDWTDDGGYLQRGYRVEIKHTRPSVSKDAAILAEVAELAKNGAITVNEMRQSLPNTDLGELTPEEEQALQDKITARQPQNPFMMSGSTPPGDYQGIGNVQTPAQRTEVMSDTERALIEATRKCAADVKRIALKDYPYQGQAKPSITDRVKNLFSPVNNAGDEGTWVTINGTHILIKDGETAADAFKRTTGKKLEGGSSGGDAIESTDDEEIDLNEFLKSPPPPKPEMKLKSTGKEINPEQIPIIKSALDDSFESAQVSTSSGDTVARELQRAQGFDKTPTVISKQDFDKQSEGKRLLYRGDTKTEYIDQLKYGDYHTGLGAYGSGTYVAVGADAESVAMMYARGDKSRVSRMYLSDDADVVDYATLSTQHSAWDRELSHKVEILNTKARNALYDDQNEELSKKYIAEAQRLKTLRTVMKDNGRFATMMGYDAIKCNGGTTVGSQLVVLNRGKLIISKEG